MKIFNVLVLLLLPATSMAGELKYFDSKINFWNEKTDASPVSQTLDKPAVNENGKFPWKTYLDPKNKEFFKEGDYTPPEPFMEIARDPSDENIKNWFDFMKKKNELAKNLEEKMQLYLAKNMAVRPTVETEAQAPAPERVKVEPSGPLDPARFKVRMYFESTCPHCRRMFGVLKRLQNEGFQVEALQADSGPVPEEEKVVPIGKADQAELKKHGITSVPYLLIADSKKKALLPAVQGYHDFQEIMELIKSASRN
jgi:glutaredoxin